MDNSTGFYYRPEDYASIWRRLLVDLIDAFAVGALCIVFAAAGWGFLPKDAMLAGWAAIFFFYFVLLKRSRFRTLGYRVGRVRIVGCNGRRPSLWSLTLRMIFLVLGPLNYLIDLLWLSSDPHRQAIRDKFAQTYVVRRDAQPVGEGKLVYRYYEIFGYNFLFRDLDV